MSSMIPANVQRAANSAASLARKFLTFGDEIPSDPISRKALAALQNALEQIAASPASAAAKEQLSQELNQYIRDINTELARQSAPPAPAAAPAPEPAPAPAPAPEPVQTQPVAPQPNLVATPLPPATGATGIGFGDDDTSVFPTTPPTKANNQSEDDRGQNNGENPQSKVVAVADSPVEKSSGASSNNSVQNNGTVSPANNLTATGKTGELVSRRLFNPLSEFSSVAYRVSLYLITPEAFNDFYAKGKWVTSSLELILQSSGVTAGVDSNRNKYFNYDFYIDNISS